MKRTCPKRCWEIPARKNKDAELECLECLLMEHIEGYPSNDFGDVLGELKIEREELDDVDEG